MKKNKTIQGYILLCIVFFCAQGYAQKQANHWFPFDFYLNFNNAPFSISTLPVPHFAYQLSSIADNNGKLLFLTNNEFVYDKNFNKMPNGETGITPSSDFPFSTNSLIIPWPDSHSFYIIMNSQNYGLSYAIVDMSKNNNLGDLVQKYIVFQSNVPNKVAATGNCTKFWLLTSQDTITNGLLKRELTLFMFDSDGINLVPDTLRFEGSDQPNHLKFSPSGDKLVFNDESIKKTVLCDFNIETGKVSNSVEFFYGNYVQAYEFSPDGKKLYATVSDFLGDHSGLYQFDLDKETGEEIDNSRFLLFKGSEELFLEGLQLTPDQTILCQQLSVIGTGKSAVIEYPNESGVNCSLKIDAYNFYFFGGTPNFVSTFLSPQFDENFHISAGDALGTCSNTQLPLGEEPSYDIEYKWWPEKYLSNAAISNPKFIYDDTISVKTDFQYILEGKKGYCYNTDTITLTVHPDLDASIFGSKSVCPRVKEVDYWTKEDDRFRFEWTVDGGDLSGGQSTDSIKVNWGPTNSEASVTLTPYNELNCPSPPINFPVRINVELQTETPIGDELLCSNLATGIPYQITNTNGSVYTWESDYGNIITGQGTNKINVDWPGDGKYHLWLKEQSTTIDTVCYGVSDSLLVNLFTDSTKLEIDFAGVTRADPGSYELQWFVSDTSRIMDDIEIFVSTETRPSWILKDVRLKMENYFSFQDTIMNYTPMTFKVSSVNGCKELVESEIHTSIFLEGIADSSSNSMTLTWTPYAGWYDIEQYEVWYSKDNEGQLIRVASFKPGQYLWTNSWGADAFDHHYRIKALHGSYPFESWSNQLTLSFDHPLEIPNVFTPNGDGINDTFSFPKLEIFHENELQVYSRTGSEVYSKKNYDGSWAGGNLASGVYYYSFTEKRNQKTYKGWIQILR
jgi:gliding motility-associated-like protein